MYVNNLNVCIKTIWMCCVTLLNSKSYQIIELSTTHSKTHTNMTDVTSVEPTHKY